MTRRTLLAAAGGAIVAGMQARGQSSNTASSKRIQTRALNIGYKESGQGFPVIALHGFPDDAHAWDDVAPPLVKAGYRVLAPYLRGYGPTSFRDPQAPRMAEQAAIGQDVIDFADALNLDPFALAGYDWGGRAACIAAALHPDRVRAAVLISGYLIQNTIDPAPPGPPEAEKNLWYQYYFNTERGRAGLTANRRAICRFLWQTWSPTWHFSDEIFDRTAASFDNPDFVDCVVHSYRHRIGNAPGDPRFREAEERLAKRPGIEPPTIILRGADDTLGGREPAESADKALFPHLIARRMIQGAGHFLPREKPDAVSAALLEALSASAK
jgi:pimeloyl-ACP methyl ester carboxylesterase